jgi:hypothetical protein
MCQKPKKRNEKQISEMMVEIQQLGSMTLRCDGLVIWLQPGAAF